MRKFLILTLMLLVFAFPGQSQASPVPERYRASSAKSVVETQVEGEAEVYQRVETTVNGETVIKESSQPGRLEVKMEKTGEGQPTVTFSQESAQIIATPTSTLTLPVKLEPLNSLASQIIDFVRKLLDNLTSWFK